MQVKRWMRVAAVGLLAVLTVAMAAPASVAAPVPSQTTAAVGQTSPAPGEVAAERALVKAKLMDFGLTGAQAQSRVDLLTDQEIHALAADLEAIRPGAAFMLSTTEILLLLILVVLIAD